MQRISIEKVLPNPEQPRRYFDPDELAALAQSIKSRDVIQPIVVEEADGGYILHDGERRLRAAKLAGLATIPAVVNPPLNGHGSKERLVRALVANVQRSDLNPIETAQALRRLQTENSWSHRKLSDETGIPLAAIPKFLRLLELDDEIQELIAHGDLPKDDRVAKALLGIHDSDVRVRFAQRMARQGLTIAAIEIAAERLNARLRLSTHAAAPAEPSIALAGDLPQETKAERWESVRAAAVATCNRCDLHPGTPDPAWSLIRDAAGQTCKTCSVRDLHALDICRQCPAVDLLKRLAGVA